MKSRTQILPVSARSDAGFTLVEIMVVVVILGLLATIVGTNVLGARGVAEIKKAQTDMRGVQEAAEMYMTVNTTSQIPTVQELSERDSTDKIWLKGDAVDPWGNDYEIREGEYRNEFEVISWGPDGEADTEDDLTTAAGQEDN